MRRGSTSLWPLATIVGGGFTTVGSMALAFWLVAGGPKPNLVGCAFFLVLGLVLLLIGAKGMYREIDEQGGES